jgi:hypothetical protein
MAARLKSSILRREERGFGSISMSRLLVSGMAGGGVFMVCALAKLGALMIPGAIAVFIAGLVLTHPRFGIPLYLYMLLNFRTRFLLDADQQPAGWQAQLAGMAELKRDGLVLEASTLLAAPVVVEESGTLDGWEIIPDSAQISGFEVVTDTLFLEEG